MPSRRPALRLYRGLGALGVTGEETGPATDAARQIQPQDILEQYGGDVELAERVSRYVNELGVLAPKCLLDGWRAVRQKLIERGNQFHAFIERYSPSEAKEEGLSLLGVFLDRARALPEARDAMMDLGPQWETPDEGLFDEADPVPVPPRGKSAVWLEPEFCSLLHRNGIPMPASCRASGATTWESAAQAWDENRGTAFLLGYFALQPYIRPAGVVGDVVYWGGVAVYEIGTGVLGFFRSRALATEAVAELGALNEAHIRWMQNELRSIYRQCRAAYRIAKQHRQADDQLEALRNTDPRDEPEMPPAWDGTFPDLDGKASRIPWWIVLLVVGAGAGGMAALEK